MFSTPTIQRDLVEKLIKRGYERQPIKASITGNHHTQDEKTKKYRDEHNLCLARVNNNRLGVTSQFRYFPFLFPKLSATGIHAQSFL